MNPIRTMQVPFWNWNLHDMSFGGRLIGLRRERNLTQQAFADATGIHVQQIKRYEAGTSQPSAEALRKIEPTLPASCTRSSTTVDTCD